MIYGICYELIKSSRQYELVKDSHYYMNDKDICFEVLKIFGLKYHADIMYDVNVRVREDQLHYYQTDLFIASDNKSFDASDDMTMLVLNMDELNTKGITAYPISECGWAALYGNDKDYYDLRVFDIENLCRGGHECRGD